MSPTPTNPPEATICGRYGPLAVGLDQFGAHVVIQVSVPGPGPGPAQGEPLARFMGEWRVFGEVGSIPKDHVAFIGWVVP